MRFKFWQVWFLAIALFLSYRQLPFALCLHGLALCMHRVKEREREIHMELDSKTAGEGEREGRIKRERMRRKVKSKLIFSFLVSLLTSTPILPDHGQTPSCFLLSEQLPCTPILQRKMIRIILFAWAWGIVCLWHHSNCPKLSPVACSNWKRTENSGFMWKLEKKKPKHITFYLS